MKNTMRITELADQVKLGVLAKKLKKLWNNKEFSTMCNFISERKETTGAQSKPGVRSSTNSKTFIKNKKVRALFA